MTENRHASYIREKLRGAKDAILDDERGAVQERLWSAYLYNLSNLMAEWFLHADDQAEFEAIMHELKRFGEAVEGAGSVPTTLWTMSDADAETLAARIVRFADRYIS